MIALLRGLVANRGSDYVVLDVQGVGYRVFMASPIVESLTHGDEVTVHVHTHVRDDAIHLFGFPEEIDRDVFLSLTKVTGIGPKLGMSILSGASRAELLTAVAGGDIKRLTHIPGIGKKTAERILVELREVFKELEPSFGDLSAPEHQGSRVRSDVVSALMNLGYRGGEIDKTLALLESMPDTPDTFDVLLREALKLLR